MHNITFRPLAASDLDQMLEYINTLSQERTFIRKQGDSVSREEEEKYINGFLKDIQGKKAVKLLAFDKEKLVGVADVKMGFGSEKHVGIFGITVAKDYRDQGLGTELMQKTIQLAKKELPQLEIISLSVYDNNHRAKHIYQKMGFKQYGLLPKGTIRKGEYADHAYMYLNV